MDKLFLGTKPCVSPNLGLCVAEVFTPKFGGVTGETGTGMLCSPAVW